MKIALVTGGQGFIGSATVRGLLREGYAVRVLDIAMPGSGWHPANLRGLSSVEIVAGDVRDQKLVERLVTGCDCIVHLAGHTSHAGSMADPRMDLAHNVDGTASVLEAMRTCAPEAAMVFAGTRQIYGRPDAIPVDESHPIRPPDVNGIGKVAAEELCRLYHSVHGLRICRLRLTNIYGPRLRVKDARQMFLGIWMRRALEDGTIDVFGDGRQRRDLIHVDDVASAILAARRPEAAGLALNIGRSDTVSLVELAELVVAVVGRGQVVMVPFPADRKAIDIGDYASNADYAAQVLGWTPLIELKAGLAGMADFYREHLAEYVEQAI